MSNHPKKDLPYLGGLSTNQPIKAITMIIATYGAIDTIAEVIASTTATVRIP